MQLRPHRLVKVVAIRDLLTKLRKRTKCMDKLALRLGHLPEVCGFELLNFHFLVFTS